MYEFIDRSRSAAYAAAVQQGYRESLRDDFTTAESLLRTLPRTYVRPERLPLGHFPFIGVYEMSPSYLVFYKGESRDEKRIFVRIGQEKMTWYNRLGGQRYVLIEVSHLATAEKERLNRERYVLSHDGRVGQVSEDGRRVNEIPIDQIDNRVELISDVLRRVKPQLTTWHQLALDNKVQTTPAQGKE